MPRRPPFPSSAPAPRAGGSAAFRWPRACVGPRAKWTRLLARVAAERDRAAFAALFAHFAPRVKAYLLRLGAPAALAEDLAQEAMLSCGARRICSIPPRPRPRPGCSPSPATCASTPSAANGAPSWMPDDPDARAARRRRRRPGAGGDRKARLRLALKTLPPDQIQVVELSFFADKPHSQIAAELGIPLGTVKSRLRLAMARLQAARWESAHDRRIIQTTTCCWPMPRARPTRPPA